MPLPREGGGRACVAAARAGRWYRAEAAPAEWRGRSVDRSQAAGAGKRMTPERFIAKWRHMELTERAAAPSHFPDLPEASGQPTPSAADAKGEWHCFEKGATKIRGGEGWAEI